MVCFSFQTLSPFFFFHSRFFWFAFFVLFSVSFRFFLLFAYFFVSPYFCFLDLIWSFFECSLFSLFLFSTDSLLCLLFLKFSFFPAHLSSFLSSHFFSSLSSISCCFVFCVLVTRSCLSYSLCCVPFKYSFPSSLFLKERRRDCRFYFLHFYFTFLLNLAHPPTTTPSPPQQTSSVQTQTTQKQVRNHTITKHTLRRTRNEKTKQKRYTNLLSVFLFKFFLLFFFFFFFSIYK